MKNARAYLEAGLAAFSEYEKLCRDIDCDYEKKDNYIYSLYNRGLLEEELAALERLSFRATLEESLPLPFDTVGAVRFPEQAQFHPLKFLSCIARELNIRENTFAYDIRDGEVKTNRGTIKAKRIVVATHFPIINKHGFYFLKLYQHHSYVLALEGASDVGGMYLDERAGGFSFRNYGKYLLLGGGGHKTGETGENYDILCRFAEKNYPDATEVCCFAAQDCMSLDSMPYIGHYSGGTENIYVATGFNKWGMTGSMLSAMIISDELSGIKNEYFDYFSPQRSLLEPQLLTNIKSTVKKFFSFGKKRCPHLGCTLSWNAAERTWDCPCHGSRFDEKGEILDNPSIKKLN